MDGYCTYKYCIVDYWYDFCAYIPLLLGVPACLLQILICPRDEVTDICTKVWGTKVRVLR